MKRNENTDGEKSCRFYIGLGKKETNFIAVKAIIECTMV